MRHRIGDRNGESRRTEGSRTREAVATDLWVTDSDRPNRVQQTRKAGDRRLSQIQRVMIPPSSDFQTIRDLIAQAISRIPSATT
jgi:hypothetical protein